MELRIAARQSDLARLQAYQVGHALIQNGHSVSYHFRESLGDINQEDPLWKMPEKGVFTQDFHQGLIDGQWDMVVHSWKDLPVEDREGTLLAATMPRADTRDLLLFKKESYELVAQSKSLELLSSSPRRIYNLEPFLKESLPFDLESIEFHSVRGNILTRLKKLFAQKDRHGLIVAKAAIDRLLAVEGDEFRDNQIEFEQLLSHCLWQVLPLSSNPTAAAQGALAVEIASGRDDIQEALAAIHCQQTWDEVCFERRVFILRGESEAGETLRHFDQDLFDVSLSKPFQGPIHCFEREALDFVFPSTCNAHWVAKSDAFPEGLPVSHDHLIWTSGLETWKKLAAKGYWVNGSSESLGEQENPRLDQLFPQPKWAKWTHQDGFEQDGIQQVATYKLKRSSFPEGFENHNEYYWASGSQFEYAIELFPQILQAKHFCGPGNTFLLISKMLEKHQINQKPNVIASKSLWTQMCKDF